MRRILCRLAFLAPALAAAPLAATATATPAEPKLVVKLDKGEPFEALTFHDGLLWVGQSRRDFNSDYRLQAYDRSDALIGEVQLNHSAAFVHPYGARSVIVMGTGHTPNLTMFTIVERGSNGRLTSRTRQIPAQAWAFRWLGTIGGREYFADLSGNTNDPARDADPSLASQTLFTMPSTGSPRYLPMRIRAPFDGIKASEDTLFVLHKYQLGHPASNIARVDVASNRSTELFASPRNDLLGILALDRSTVVVTEAGESRALVLDASGAQARVLAEVPADGRPRSLARFGRCVLVGRESAKAVDVVDVRYPSEPKTLATVDFSAAGSALRGARKIEIDAQTARIYVRSAYACNPMAEVCDVEWNNIFSAKIEDTDALARCQTP